MLCVARTPSGTSVVRRSSRALPNLPHGAQRRVRCLFKVNERQQEQGSVDVDEALPPITAPSTGLPKTTAEKLASEPIIDENEWTLSFQERAKLAGRRLKARWDVLDDKRTIVGLTVGTGVTLWLSASFLHAVDKAPVLPDLFTFIGLSYSAAFFWQYVLFFDGREKLRRAVSRTYHLARDILENEDGPWGDGRRPVATTRSPSLQQANKDITRAAIEPIAQANSSASGAHSDRLQSHATPGGTPTAPFPRTKQAGGRGSMADGVRTRSTALPALVSGRATFALDTLPLAGFTLAPTRGRRAAAVRALPDGSEDQGVGATERDVKLNEWSAQADGAVAPGPARSQTNNSAHPDRNAAPHHMGPGTVTDDAVWIAAAETASNAEQGSGEDVDCTKQPPNTTPCPVPGSAPHQEELVYNDDIWYRAEPAAGIVVDKEYGDRARMTVDQA